MRKKYYEELSNTQIFKGIKDERLPQFLMALSPAVQEFSKGEYIYLEGDKNIDLAIILLGSVEIIKNDYWGREFLIAKLKEYDIFGETFAMMKDAPIPIDARAKENSIVMKINIRNINDIDGNFSIEEKIFKENLIKLFASKNYYLSKRLDIISQRKTRDKLLEFLMQKRGITGSNTFEIEFNRNELADYLCVERSALSHEMSKMQDEGIIRYRKNRFTLID